MSDYYYFHSCSGSFHADFYEFILNYKPLKQA